ncbi:hypothetical protein BGZ81_005025 [Podila clonocystis]|nr:hypothetical protein BGZ81_005025 [Podila clonocystis]
MSTSPATTDATMSSTPDSQKDTASLILPSPPASPKTKRPFDEIEDTDTTSDEVPTSPSTTTTSPRSKTIRHQLQPPKAVLAVQLLHPDRHHQLALPELHRTETPATTPALSTAIPQPAMHSLSGTRVLTNVPQPKDVQVNNQLYGAICHEEEIRQNMMYEAYLGTPAADLMLEFTKGSQEVVRERATSEAQNQDAVDRASRPRIQFSEIVQMCEYYGEEAPERSLGTTVEVSGATGSNRQPYKVVKSGVQKRTQNSNKRTPPLTSLENFPRHHSGEGSKSSIKQSHEGPNGSVNQILESSKGSIGKSRKDFKRGIIQRHGDSKSIIDQRHGDRPKKSVTLADKNVEIQFSRMRLDCESNMATVAKRGGDPSNMPSLISRLSLTDRLRPRRGPCGATPSCKVIYEPSLRMKRNYDRMWARGFYPMTSVTSVLRLRKGVLEDGKFDVLRDVYGLG